MNGVAQRRSLHPPQRERADDAQHNGDSEMFLVQFLSNTIINAILIALGLMLLAGRF